jgi:tetratricopeptide (TPR) repeat protein
MLKYEIIMNIKKEIKSALEYYQAGNLQQAENIYRRILKVQPDNADALYYLGIICYQLGNYGHAI